MLPGFLYARPRLRTTWAARTWVKKTQAARHLGRARPRPRTAWVSLRAAQVARDLGSAHLGETKPRQRAAQVTRNPSRVLPGFLGSFSFFFFFFFPSLGFL